MSRDDHEVRDAGINNELPPGIEEHARTLCDNDFFVQSVWKVLAGYHDLRGMELFNKQMGKKEAKLAAERVINAARNLQHEIRIYHIGGLILRDSKAYLESKKIVEIPTARFQAIIDIEKLYTEHLEYLNSLTGRSTKQNSLGWLARSMLNVFTAYEVDADKLNGFLTFAMAAVSPGGNTPSQRAIETQVSKARN